MLSLKNITKDYYVGENTIRALKNVSIDFRESEFVSILGPSGCGKTTLLNIIGGLDHYTDGDLVINGRSTRTYRDKDWDSYRNHKIGFVFQNYNLIPHQTVLSNVELALTLSGVSKSERRRRAKTALERVGLSDQITKKPNQLSGGQMQRVAIARALVNDPDILLADEPTGALDTSTSVQIMDILKEISKDRLIIMVTHNPDLADQYSTRTIRLIDGVIVSDSNPYDVTAEEQPAPPETARVEKKKKEKTSMSFFTALSLSFNNLMTKKGRTFLTSFAGSIGIIGIALILALANGIQTYINTVQENTLSSYPISIQAEEADMSSLLMNLTQQNSEDREPHDNDAVYESHVMYQLINSLTNVTVTKNNLTAFKAYLDRETADPDSRLAKAISTIQYRYDVSINAYVKDADGNYAQADVMGLFTKMAESSGYVTSSYLSMVNSMSSRFSSIQIWDEILPGSNGELISDLIYDQYDLVYGAWPSNENEVVLVLNERNEVSDLVLYSLGLITAQDMMDTITKAMQGETIEIVNHAWSYEEICGITFRLLADTDYYADTDGDGIYEDISSDSNRMTLLLDNARQITISGLIKPNPDSTSTALNGYICYTKALTEAIIGEIDSSDIVKLQKSDAYANKNILSGLPFEIDEKTGLTDAEKAEQIREYFAGLSDKQKTEMYIDILSKAPDSYVDGLVSAQMARYDTREKQEALIAQNYGMSSEEIHDFLTPYSDEELTQMIKGFIEEMIKTSYAQQQKAAVEEAITTPSEEETDALSAMTLMMLRSREAKEAYILSKWRESSGLSDEEISTYLSAKTDEEIDGITQFLAREDAVARYKSMVEPTSDIAYAKGAALFDAHIDACDEHTLAGYYDAYMPDQVSRKTRDEVLKSLGYTSLDSPSSINIYASTFENKDVIADVITNEYNKSVPEEDRISYTDYVKILMSSITTIINVISYVLIAFVAISLVVSSIMIGIITYISVLERTKEIGILRAIGASKKDISRVFNAETTVIGFGSGLIGILVTLILIVPINIIIRAVSGINNIGAILPWAGAAILVGISVILTLIAGLIPSKLASKKDPVIALRTE